MHSGNRCITLLKANLKLREHVPFPFAFKNCVCFGISEMVKVSCVPGENSGGGGSIVSFYCVVVFISAFFSFLLSRGKTCRREKQQARNGDGERETVEACGRTELQTLFSHEPPTPIWQPQDLRCLSFRLRRTLHPLLTISVSACRWNDIFQV